MSCINVSASIFNTSTAASGKFAPNINVSASIFSTSTAASGKFAPNINVSASIFSTSIAASGKFVCAIPSGFIIKFEKDCLVWSNSDNRVGTIKYNTLTSTHSWSLEEIQIEELL